MKMLTYDEIFRCIFVNLRWCGIPTDGSRLGILFYTLALNMILAIIEELSFFVVKSSSENFLVLTGLAPCVCIVTRSLLKIVAIAQKRTKFFKLHQSLNELYEEILNDDVKRKLVCADIGNVKRITNYNYMLNLCLITVYNFSTTVTGIYEYVSKGEVVLILPYPVVVPFATDVFRNWFIVYLHVIIAGFCTILYVTAVDSLYWNLSAQVCANYSILSYQIEHLNPSNTNTLVNIIKRHQYINQLSRDLDDVFTMPNFFNIIVGSIEICALGFNITFGEWSKMPGFILFISSELLQIFGMSVFGERLIRESRRIGDAAFSCEWYNMDEKSKKILLFILLRSRKPQTLTAYKFSTVSYETFTRIISTSWSYFTILRKVYNPNS